MIATLLLIALAQTPVPLPLPVPSGSSAAHPAALSVLDWTKSGRSTSTPWYGAPAGTIDCVAGASAGTLSCAGATSVKYGSGYTTTGSPFHPFGFIGENDVPTAVLNGNGAYTLGDVGGLSQAGGGSVCGVAYQTGTTLHPIIAKASTSTMADGWGIFFNGSGGLTMRVIKSAGNSTDLVATSGGAGSSTLHVFCYSYSSAALIANVDGVAPSPIVTPKFPIAQNDTLPLVVGAWANYDYLLLGGIIRVTIWDGTTFTASQLAQMVAGMWSTLTSTGEIATVTAAAGSCTPLPGGTAYALPANVPCITSSGVTIGTVTASIPKASGASYYSANKGAWTAIGGANITVPNGSITRVAECTKINCRK